MHNVPSLFSSGQFCCDNLETTQTKTLGTHLIENFTKNNFIIDNFSIFREIWSTKLFGAS